MRSRGKERRINLPNNGGDTAPQRDAGRLQPDAAAGGVLADEFIAVLITTVAARLNRGSTNFYRTRWDIGMLEWRVLLVLQRTKALNVRGLAGAAGLDKAAVSRTLTVLEDRGLVSVEQMQSRGRAAIASLTPKGEALCANILRASRDRQEQLFQVFPKADAEALSTMLRQLSLALHAVGWDASASGS
jgi:DNA-binding MarR family transcriptional regulator